MSYKLLNRFAAIDLFRYIKNGDLSIELEFEKQKELFSRFEESLITNGINIDKDNAIICSYKNKERKIEIYPLYAKLDLNSCDKDTIYITNYSIRNNPDLIASKVINIMKNKN